MRNNPKMEKLVCLYTHSVACMHMVATMGPIGCLHKGLHGKVGGCFFESTFEQELGVGCLSPSWRCVGGEDATAGTHEGSFEGQERLSL